jgi:hypothetical protein
MSRDPEAGPMPLLATNPVVRAALVAVAAGILVAAAAAAAAAPT